MGLDQAEAWAYHAVRASHLLGTDDFLSFLLAGTELSETHLGGVQRSFWATGGVGVQELCRRVADSACGPDVSDKLLRDRYLDRAGDHSGFHNFLCP